jgi:hypothetical protein
MKIEFPSREDLMRWLKNTTSAVLLSISLVGGVQEFHVQASSSKALTNITQSSQEYFEEGAYMVEYESSSDKEGDDLVYTTVATAFTVKARLALHPEKEIGGFDSLRESLSGFEYTAKIELKEFGYFGHLLIIIPENPEELEELKKTLHKLSLAYIFPDGTGTINENNMKMGQGLWA